MFSKFLSGKNAETLEAMEMQWRLEFAKAKRKFDKKKNKKKKGRPAMGTLRIPILNDDGNGKNSLSDLSEIARSVATTRAGRRVHDKVTANQRKKKETCKTVFDVYFCLFVPRFFVCFFAIFCLFVDCFFACLSITFLLVFSLFFYLLVD